MFCTSLGSDGDGPECDVEHMPWMLRTKYYAAQVCDWVGRHRLSRAHRNTLCPTPKPHNAQTHILIPLEDDTVTIHLLPQATAFVLVLDATQVCLPCLYAVCCSVRANTTRGSEPPRWSCTAAVPLRL